MRKNYFFAALAAAVLSVGSLVAQPTLTAASISPAIGVAYQSTQMDPAGVTSGPAGANVTWNFTQLSPMASPYTVSMYNLAGSAYQAQFPGGTHYSTSSVNSTVGVYIYNGSEYAIRGLIIDSGPTFDYSDPQKFLTFPFTYNNSFNDSYTATFTSGVPFTRQGNQAATADAYGTLQLPGGQVVSDVIRVKVMDNTADVYNGITVLATATETYYWYKAGHPLPVLAVSTITANGQSSSSVVMSPPVVTAVSDEHSLEMLVQVYPNPAKSTLNFRTALDQQQVLVATLVNGMGQQVRTQEYAGVVAGTESSLSVDGLSSGIYFLQLQSGEKSTIQKIVVE